MPDMPDIPDIPDIPDMPEWSCEVMMQVCGSEQVASECERMRSLLRLYEEVGIKRSCNLKMDDGCLGMKISLNGHRWERCQGQDSEACVGCFPRNSGW